MQKQPERMIVVPFPEVEGQRVALRESGVTQVPEITYVDVILRGQLSANVAPVVVPSARNRPGLRRCHSKCATRERRFTQELLIGKHFCVIGMRDSDQANVVDVV